MAKKKQKLPRVITLANQKGGTGKSTITASVATAAGEAGLRVLVLDVDPQADATSMLGVDGLTAERTIVDVLAGECDLEEAVVAEAVPGVDVVPGHPDMANVELTLAGQMMREQFLTQNIEGRVGGYDVVLIDSPPNLGLLTVNALVACDAVVGVIAMTDRNAYKGLLALTQTVTALQKHFSLEIGGIVRNQVKRDRLTYQVLEAELEASGLPVFETQIPQAAAFHNACVESRPITHFAPDSVPAQMIRRLTGEILAAELAAAGAKRGVAA